MKNLITFLFLLACSASQAVADYAVFYNHEDLTAIAANVQATLASNYDVYLTTSEKNFCKQTFQKHWNGGLKNWATAPLAGVLDPNEGDFDALIVVVSGNQIFKQDLVTALSIVGTKVPNASYMLAIAADLAGTAVEPWPQ